MSRVLALAVALVVMAAPAAAAACPRTSVTAMEHDVMCPVCGTSLALARESPQAQRERAFIARLARRCLSRKQIEDALVAQFGTAVLAEPRASGFDLSAYVVPAAVLLAAAAALARAAIRRATRPAVERPPAALDADDARRVALELRRLD
jgi:cytochrome c-type biogenesis protein CcmH/NrfF